MDILVDKSLFAVALWIVSLFFGLLIPWLLLRSIITKSQSGQCSHNNETANLLPEVPYTNYQAIDGSAGVLYRAKNCLTRCKESLLKYNVISFINCCCGGLFLGLCFLELLPEARRDVTEILMKTDVETSLPVTEFFVSIGLILVMLIEQAVDACLRRLKRRRSRLNDACVTTDDADANSRKRSSCCDYSNILTSQTNFIVGNNDAENDENDNDMIVEESETDGATRSIVLVTMLSVHSVLEGLALGLESTLKNLVQLFVGISVHKSVISFGLGMKLLETFASGRIAIAVVGMFLFCTGSPLGAAIGIVTSLNTYNATGTEPGNSTEATPHNSTDTVPLDQVSARSYANAVLQCLATGSFFYLTFIEMIPLEFSHTEHHNAVEGNGCSSQPQTSRKKPINPMVKLMGFLLGFFTVTGLQFI